MEHHGAIVERAIRKREVSITILAKRLGVNRRTIYYWFNQGNLSFELINKIGYLIGHDFSKDLPSLSQHNNYSLNTQPSHRNAADDDSIEADVVYWKKKYISLLEKYNEELDKFAIPALAE